MSDTDSSRIYVRSRARKDPRELKDPVEVLKEVTAGEGVPPVLSDGQGGVRSLPRVTPEICAIIRELRGELLSKEISELLGFAPSTISKHSQGNCAHDAKVASPPDNPRRASNGAPLAKVTDRDTMIVTSSGSSTFHKNADGEPACGHGHREEGVNRGSERDPVDAYVWYKPCKRCFWRHYHDGLVSRRIAEIEYELAKRDR